MEFEFDGVPAVPLVVQADPDRESVDGRLRLGSRPRPVDVPASETPVDLGRTRVLANPRTRLTGVVSGAESLTGLLLNSGAFTRRRCRAHTRASRSRAHTWRRTAPSPIEVQAT